MKTKICTKCGIEKKLSEFHKHKIGKFGYNSVCKICVKKYQDKNKIKISIQKKSYRDNNKEKTIKYQKEYYQKNKEKQKLKAKQYRIENPNKVKLSFSNWFLNNLDYYKQYYIKNQDKLKKQNKYKYKFSKERINNYVKNRRKIDVAFRLTKNLRSRIWIALKGYSKSLSTMFLIGCEIDYLMYYLQEQFTRGMSWDNYGDWHIDHKRPCARFDLSKKSEQLKCFNYTNLQPLWAIDNLKKGNR